MNRSPAETQRFWRDPLFHAALTSGLLFWLVLYFIQQPLIQWGWPLLQPWQFLLPVVFYPLVEEVVFRGLLQELVHEYISVVFTAMQFLTHCPLWAVLVLFRSLVFGFFKDRTGRLPAPMLLHVFYNAGFFWLFVTPA